ncbi:xanthine dehydrogenase family protein molybdopterin-binding subunit [Proteiniborus sp. MB09-C3]|uniref:xanthine dehydrogenase family protein molybdopterin-binding subunit n=1 Tax=Proteiniborus sp. MB09-C3 TaxID=3050072 RepID=UPI00255446A9|nr:xanthine dehydrogenase family protein molybdopterin-binding subunit [Proteiniborus sp. MB09-C3]WIV11926.1 xanthine dehydrogenase family protein molybdopterin-binding subunit [Proteiniborus sp. MB09-C3]
MSDKQYKHIGKPYDRKEAQEKVTGQAVYVHDMELPGMLYAKCLHSPYAHAEIVSIDTSEAKALPGVKAVITGDDAPYLVGLYMVDKNVIARRRVRYQGEIVAAVAAENEVIAERAISLIKVEYKELPVVHTIDESLEGKILLHENLHTYEHMEGVFFPKAHTNIASWNRTKKGDVNKGFEEADFIFEDEFSVPAVAHVPMETHVTIAQADPYSNKVKIWSSAQSPFAVRQLLAKSLGISKSDVHVVVPYIGGGFGGKAGIHLEPLVTVLSRAAKGRPVKLKATREEEFNLLPTRAGMRSRFKTGVKKDGTITSMIVYHDWDSGAYADYAVNVGKTAVYSGAGPYVIPNIELHSRTLYTNKVFSTAYRGFGHLETHWAVERHMDIIAQKLGIDPYDFRMKNLLHPGTTTISGELIYDTTGSPKACLDAVAKEIGWTGRKSEEERLAELKTGKIRGKGFAMLQKAPAMPSNTSTSAIMQMNEDGHVKVMIGAVDMGQGANTIMAQVAAEELRIPIEDVEVVWNVDTDKHPYDWNTVASKYTFMGGNAVRKAARNMVNQMKEVAAQVLRCHPDELTHGDGYIYHIHQTHRRIPYTKLAMGYAYENGNGIGGPVISHGIYMASGLTNPHPETGQGRPGLVWTFGAHGVEVEVDVETGEVHVIKIASAFDIGQCINKKLVDGQVFGGVIQGIGSALVEGYKFSPNGKLLNPSFTDNKIPTAKDIPDEIIPIYIENPESAQVDGPYGARGIGEHPMISVPSAIGNALYDALGINFHRLPLSPENVALAISNSKKDE